MKMQKNNAMQKNEDPHVWQKLGGSSRPPPSVSRNANIDLLVIFFMFSLTLFLFVSSKRNIIEARKFVRKQKLTDDHLKNYCVDLNLLALLACYCLKNVIFLYHHIIVSLYI